MLCVRKKFKPYKKEMVIYATVSLRSLIMEEGRFLLMCIVLVEVLLPLLTASYSLSPTTAGSQQLFDAQMFLPQSLVYFPT